MKHLLVLTSFLVSLTLSAQIDSFKLNQVHNPDYKRKLLEIDVLFNQFYELNNPTYNKQGSAKSSRIGGNLGTTYSSIKNTSKYQGTSFIRAYVNGASDKNDAFENLSEEQSFTGNGDYNSLNRFYLTESPINHLVVNPKVELYYNSANSSHNYGNPTINQLSESEHLNYSVESDLGWGHGRLENVSDARIIIFILEDLKKNNLLAREPSIAEINELANLAIFVKNQRFFDSRIKRIYELTALDSLMKEKGLVPDDQVGYHTILQDNWNYSVNPYRQTGWLFQYGLTPHIGSRWSDTKNEELVDTVNSTAFNNVNSRYTENYRVSAFIKYGWHNPITQSLQNDLNAEIKTGVLKDFYDNENYRNNSQRTSTTINNAFYYLASIKDEFGIYPTNRTFVSISIGTEYRKTFEFDRTFQNRLRTNDIFSATGGLNGYYYFSPQLRISAELDARYMYRINKNTNQNDQLLPTSENNNWYNNTTVRLTYKIF